MHSLSFASTLILLSCVVQSHQLFNNHMILMAVADSCKVQNSMCPKAEYAKFTGNLYQWDHKAILTSNAIKKYKNEDIKLSELPNFFRKHFCCTEGKCLRACGFYPIEEEIDLVKNFPNYAADIFSLGLPEFKKFEQPVMRFLAVNGDSEITYYPADVEDFRDLVNARELLLVRLLMQKDLI